MSKQPVALMSDEEFEALERALVLEAAVDREASIDELYEKLGQLIFFARYWRDCASKDPNALREMQSTEVG